MCAAKAHMLLPPRGDIGRSGLDSGSLLRCFRTGSERKLSTVEDGLVATRASACLHFRVSLAAICPSVEAASLPCGVRRLGPPLPSSASSLLCQLLRRAGILGRAAIGHHWRKNRSPVTSPGMRTRHFRPSGSRTEHSSPDSIGRQSSRHGSVRSGASVSVALSQQSVSVRQ